MSRKSDISIDLGLFGGSAKNIDHYIVTGPDIKLAANAALSVSTTTLSVHPLKQAIANGAKVRFGEIDGITAGLVATLGADAAYGATSITVTALTGSLQMGDVGHQCQDVTAWTFTFKVYTDVEGTAALSKTPSITTAGEGAVRTALTAMDTGMTLTPGTTYSYRLSRSNSGSEDVGLAYGALALRV